MWQEKELGGRGRRREEAVRGNRKGQGSRERKQVMFREQHFCMEAYA